MHVIPDTKHTELTNVFRISRGDNAVLLRYLYQFKDLVSERIVSLESRLDAKDRHGIRRVMHSMRPQIEFFGVKDVIPRIARLELEHTSIPWEELNDIVRSVIDKLHSAIIEIENIIKINFKE